ncbi:hypothetical protein KSF_054540 [Reticulibacter mediterranei]|uniref:Uncharacterized protein n=1 Tax=Reticulibacter mediterranei TaxID=2778369 RepID=A0A8J3IU98_9CHLR|nr:hypothetical protein KSF_054540 [Reticulibacter mediterranei]
MRRRTNLRNIWKQARKTLKGQFLTFASTLFILSLVAGLLITQALRQASTDLDMIANGSVPSIDAAQAMSQYIEDIDAKAADYLAAASLTEQTPCSIIGSTRNPGNLTGHDCDQLNIDAELILANKQLYIAIHNVTYPGERTALQRITAGLEEYSNDIAIEEHEYGLAASQTDPHDEHLQKAYQAYLAATNVLNVRITKPPTLDANNTPVYDEATLPNCNIEGRSIAANDWPLGSLQENIDCLSSINKGYLDAAYTDTMNFLGITTALLSLLCLVLCGLLVFVLLRMILLTHRLVNPGLTLATLTAFVVSFVVLTNFIGMSGRHGAFGLMVKDAYESVYDSTLLKRYATAANADESRWLIAVDFSDQAEIQRWQQDWDTNRTHVNALIAQAVGNRTWPEEDQPLANIQSHWKIYTDIDPQIRALAMKTTNPARIHDAETLSTGKSNDNFSAFTDAVDRLGQANRGYYSRTYTLTNAAVLHNILLSSMLFPLIGLLTVWGIARRLKDF